MATVTLKNITKIYDSDNPAVKNINIEIQDKEFVVLVGPSGCGKSTTLRMIAGLEDITDGELFIDGELVNDVSPKDRDIAMVFQNYALYPHMTVYGNMAFGLKLRKFPKSEIDERVRNASKILGLDEFLDRKPKSLSGGQRQRVAVGRAIVRHPKVFLFDEPLSNLDAKLRVQMRTEISKLHRKLGATMIYVTHDQTEAMTMGDKIVIMNNGIIHQIDKPLEIYNNPADKFVAGFIGSPSMNFIKGSIIEENKYYFESKDKVVKIELPPGKLSKLVKSKNKIIQIGIRPEDIQDINMMEKDFKNDFEAVIEVVEPMGNEIFLYLEIAGSQVISRIPVLNYPTPGQNIKLYVNLDKLQFYDDETGERLG